MVIADIVEYVRAMDGVLVLAPTEGDGYPEIAWGDVFFYYAPDGVVPKAQPFATIVTKDYPDDTMSQLERSDVFRVNIAAGSQEFRRWIGPESHDSPATPIDPSALDMVMPHPVYGNLHWLAVLNPGPRTTAAVRELLTTAHDLARGRFNRRATTPSGAD